MDLVGVVVVFAVVVMLGLGFWHATSRRSRLNRVLGGLLAVVAAAWLLAVLAITAGFYDADGLTECWPDCSLWQKIVRWTFWFGAPLAGVLALVIGIRAVLERLSLRG